ncbi:site-2 protease family protein [Patescibacteria group bacterium]|nr:site-2 protease family protein [Patescibacteria group bacterium]
MEFLLSLLVFIVIFSAIILIHEFGHFYVARKVGIKVEEFGIGLPPRAWGKKIRGVLYSINWIPFGGFVRMYGEDSVNPKILQSKDSFASKSVWKRMMVVTAGVFMNFLLAFVLLTIGFSVGIEPLIMNSQDFTQAVDDNVVTIEHGIFVSIVEEDGVAYAAGLRVGDKIISINNKDLNFGQLALLNIAADEPIVLNVLNESGFHDVSWQVTSDDFDYGAEFYSATYLPRITLKDLDISHSLYIDGFREGDIITKVNGHEVYEISGLLRILNNRNNADEAAKYEVVRNNEVVELSSTFVLTDITLNENDDFLCDICLERAIITGVNPGSPANEAGLEAGDIILEVTNQELEDPSQLALITAENIGNEIVYEIDRNGQLINLNITPGEDGMIGILFASTVMYEGQGVTMYDLNYLTSVKEIKNVSYPVHIAAKQSLFEMKRLAVLTVEMFGNLVKSVTSKLVVPEGVAGPVGIFQITQQVFVEDGLFALLRLVALLSLSLAVLNILPFPALDGGRLIFLIFEAVTRKRVSAKWESLFHMIGFLLLITLLVFITYSDILAAL